MCCELHGITRGLTGKGHQNAGHGQTRREVGPCLSPSYHPPATPPPRLQRNGSRHGTVPHWTQHSPLLADALLAELRAEDRPYER